MVGLKRGKGLTERVHAGKVRQNFKMKKKIAIIVGNSLIARNYIVTNTFENIEEEYNCILYANKKTISSEDKKQLLEGNRFKQYTMSRSLGLISQIMNDANMYKQINKSKSFQYRINRKLKPRRTQKLKSIKQIRERINLLIYRLTVYCISKNILLQSAVKKTIEIIVKREELYKILKNEKYSTIIVPTMGSQAELDITGFMQEEADRTKDNRVNIVWLFDNWDNLSSKTVNTFKAKACSVWGEQSKLHAMSIQGYQEKQIWTLGTPRFEKYYKEQETKKRIMRERKQINYILFCGVALDYDERKVINKIADWSRDQSKKVKILYRPHPWGERYQNAITCKYDELVELDKSTLKKNTKDGIYDTEKYIELINNADLVIGGSTSMLIEAAILKKKYILLAHKENGGRSPYESLIGYEHIGVATGLSNIKVCYDLDRLPEAIEQTKDLRIEENDTILNYIITKECSRYKDNLRNKILSILE